MNKKIKEILEIQEDSDYKRLSIEDILLLKEYIEKLEKENARLKENLQQEKKDFKEANDYCFELKGYKSRIDKAIECINYYAIENSDYEKIYNIEEKTLLDILGGKNG